MPFDQLEQKEATGFLLQIVGTLPLRQQEVIQLKFQNDLSYQQITEIMQTTANNVGVLLHTALKTLRIVPSFPDASRPWRMMSSA